MSHESCPCCGGEAKHQIVELDDSIEEYQVIRCEKCGLETKWCNSESEAWDAWDTRPTTTVRIETGEYPEGGLWQYEITKCCEEVIINESKHCPECGKEIVR